jgi:hypothetical protein
MTVSSLFLSIARTAIRHPLIVGQVTELLKRAPWAKSYRGRGIRKRSAAGATNFASMKPWRESTKI